jgi:hypothetical protein
MAPPQRCGEVPPRGGDFTAARGEFFKKNQFKNTSGVQRDTLDEDDSEIWEHFRRFFADLFCLLEIWFCSVFRGTGKVVLGV